MKVVFFGSPEAALPSLEKLLGAGYEVPLIITQPDRPAGRGKSLSPPPVKEFALGRGIPVLQPAKIRRDDAVQDALKAVNPDVQVVVAYGQILPARIIYLPRFHSVNVHFSLLPKYRGAAPVEWAILSGETKTGVTVFELNEQMDEGGILSQEETDIRPEEDARELERRLALIGADLLVRTLSSIGRIVVRPQDHSLATSAPKMEKEQGRIDWTMNAEAVARKVRAFAGRSGAFAFLRGLRIILRSGRTIGTGAAVPRAGEILAVGKDGIDVACGSGSVYRVQRLQRENRKEMEALAFSLGLRLKPGDVFE